SPVAGGAWKAAAPALRANPAISSAGTRLARLAVAPGALVLLTAAPSGTPGRPLPPLGRPRPSLLLLAVLEREDIDDTVEVVGLRLGLLDRGIGLLHQGRVVLRHLVELAD